MQQPNYYNEHEQLVNNIQQMDMSFESNRSSNTSWTMDSPTPSSSASSLSNTSSMRRKNAWSSPSIGVNLRVTGQCSQGGRKYMEDYFSVAYQQSENAKDLEYAFIGIYDGHGGAEAAVFAKEHLMMEIINQKLFWSDSDQDVLRAIREGYIATHYAMWREQAKWPKTANGLPSTAGTTATIAFIRREKIYIGHVGDSGIVLGYQNENENFWRSKQLTTDHKPESVREKDRIKRSGGKVVVKSGVPRVVWNRPRNVNHVGPVRQNTPVDEIPFLAVARSLGDLWSYNLAKNEFIVSPDPDVKVIKINPKSFRCLIFGTDGLWNVLNPQEAVDCVYEKEIFNERLQVKSDSSLNGLTWTNPSKCLVDTALKTWSSKKMRADNTSVVTVILYPSANSDMCNYSKKDTGNLCMHTDFPNFNDVIPYQDIAQKYFPPMEYQNLSFDDGESEIISLEKEINPFFAKSNNSCVTYWENINNSRVNNLQDKQEWQSRLSNIIYNEESAFEVNGKSHTESINEDGDEDERNLSMKSDACINYLDYPSDSCISIDSSLSSSSQGDGIFLKSFAESYNSLLTDQMTSCSTSSSNKIYKSLSHKEMDDIMQEQQLYQQECMSEEEGYSLTKLETRREQQRFNNVQTFKILQKNQISSPITSNVDMAALEETSTPHNFWNLTYQDTATFSGYQNNHEEEKPFELHSLLQQERAEEQQVELERFEMQRRMNANDTRSTIAPLVNRECVDSANDNQTFTEGSFVEEYLEEEMPMEDETVQINEISSSVIDSTESESIEHLLDSSSEPEFHSDDESLVLEKIEKIEIVHNKPRKMPKKVKSQYIKVPLIANISSKMSNSYKNYRKNSPSSVGQTHYLNVPNENDRVSVTTNYRLNKYPLQLTNSTTSYTSRTTMVNNSERRQLRSNSVIVDFTKRTLRTRNTLSKDMKAKTSLLSGIKRSISVSSPLMYSNVSNKPQKSSAKCNKIIGTNNVSAEPQCKKSECGNLPIISAANASLTRLMNLRSRQIPQLSSKTSISALQLNAKSARAGKYGPTSSTSPLSQSERRSLRNLPQKISSKESVSNFSKSTNLQSSIGTFALQSRSPKIINGSRGTVATTSRTRTLIKASESDHQKGSIATITAIYGGNKRPNLRSSSISVTSSASAPVLYRLTRSRSSRIKPEM